MTDVQKQLQQIRAALSWCEETPHGEAMQAKGLTALAEIKVALEEGVGVSAPNFGENEVAGLAVAFKALLVRAGGRVEITEAELLHARTLLARVEADPEVMVVELVEGHGPPDTPRFDADWHYPEDFASLEREEGS